MTSLLLKVADSSLNCRNFLRGPNLATFAKNFNFADERIWRRARSQKAFPQRFDHPSPSPAEFQWKAATGSNSNTAPIYCSPKDVIRLDIRLQPKHVSSL